MLRILGSVALIYLFVVIGMYFMQRNVMYYPVNVEVSPKNWGVPEMQVVKFTTEDGLELSAWYRPARPNKPTILYLHGNGAHIGLRGPLVKPYLDQGLGVLLVTYRGYSGNPGKPTETGLYRDANAAYKFLRQQNVAPECIVLYGESLGTAVAVNLASNHKVGALVLQSALSSGVDVAKHHYPFLPVNWLLKDRYDAIQLIQSIHRPMLFLHGVNDKIVPMEISQKLFKQANPPKQYLQYPGYGHNDLDSQEMVEHVLGFLQRYVRC